MDAPIHEEFTPLFERVLILPDAVEVKTETGIILSVDARKRPNTGKIISAGHLINEAKCPIKVGDRVLYQRYSGLDVTLDGQIYHLVMANDLLGVLSKDSTAKFSLNTP